MPVIKEGQTRPHPESTVPGILPEFFDQYAVRLKDPDYSKPTPNVITSSIIPSLFMLTSVEAQGGASPTMEALRDKFERALIEDEKSSVIALSDFHKDLLIGRWTFRANELEGKERKKVDKMGEDIKSELRGKESNISAQFGTEMKKGFGHIVPGFGGK